ncbi:AAA family ATPase [Cognatiyoonia sp. IB215182]|uniref:AAA family ATPase n=1 Tax=Cognatiyoonia sp. IB215182 TaxID=3097353 RepID=UPI002A119E60|nr:AAA family ATPase [Cognatiyoonia sp. IB215182]MDX8353998.1 AAA family ATPase [Cognatiyoonia sp. IB215182]
MILKGNERGYGAELARHLMNPRDNDHVTLHSLRGFLADDLLGAFAEAEAISSVTKCQKYLFSLSFNPPPNADVSVTQFEAAVGQAEERLGLTGQPRAIVFHEKNGRRHAHAVWSRIDGHELKAINLPHYKRKLFGLSREMYLSHDWDMPQGFKDASKRDPLNYQQQEAGQAKRAQRDPKALKAMFQGCWESSDSRAGFEAALKEQGFVLARGDRRGFVAVDAEGKAWSLSRWCGVKPKQMRARLGSETALLSVDEVAHQTRDLPKQSVEPQNVAFEARRAKLVAAQREERAALLQQQEQQRVADFATRRARLPKGLRGLLSRATGQYQKNLEKIAEDAKAAELRDREAQQALVSKHLEERRALTRDGQRQGLASAFHAQVKPDPKQTLVLNHDQLPQSSAQLIAKPDLVLGHISEKKASFTRVDVLRALAQKIDDPMVLQNAAHRTMASPQLVRLSEDGCTPHFTTTDYQAAEKTLDRSAQALATQRGHSVANHHLTSAVRVQNAKMKSAFGGQLSREQQAALRHVLGEKQLSSVVGLAGAGKSTMLATANDAWARQGITVHGAALAGKAAEELQSASGIQSRTLASLELSWKNGHAPIKPGDVLVIDEAGMIGTRQMARITDKMNEIGAKLVLVGDPDQLQPIEAGTPFRSIVDTHGTARLTEIHRQKADWQKQASRDLAKGDISNAVDAYRKREAVTQSDTRADAIEALVETYAMDVAAHGTAKSRLAFAHKRKDVHALNQAIRAALRSGTDAPPPETLFSTDTGPRVFAEHDRLVFTRNDKDIGVKNGMLGTVTKAQNGEITVALDGENERIVCFNPSDFRSFDHGFAVTIHKSQGTTVDQSYVLASRSMDRHLAYVAMTRHRDDMRLFVNTRDRPIWATQQRRHIQPTRTRNRDGPSMS